MVDAVSNAKNALALSQAMRLKEAGLGALVSRKEL